jgi:hypothetical protein
VWTYLLGPFLSFLPARWRRVVAPPDAVQWPRAATLSGVLEFVLAVFALVYWYSYSVTSWISRGLDAALIGRVSATDHDIGITALFLFAMHPLTWLLAFFAAEGAVRFCAAAFTGTTFGTFPLFIIGKVLDAPFRSSAQERPFEQSDVSSYVSAVRDSVLSSRGSDPSDELRFSRDAEGQTLEIRSSRAKADWQPPRILRYAEEYYRLEQTARASAPRPFVYRFRKLVAGVPSRTVIFYNPEFPLIVGEPPHLRGLRVPNP